MLNGTPHARILIYSHDTFGLGHLRRCRTIAQALVERQKHLSVLILSGSPIIGSYEFRTRVDFVRIPGVIKLRNGEYSSLSLHMDIAEVLRLRESVIRHTAEAFQPDVFLVDKEPLGLRGEIGETLQMLKGAGTRLVLGLREVLDHPALLAEEWKRKSAVAALSALYDQIWVYGLPNMCEPLKGLSLPKSVQDKIVYTGYLRSSVPAQLPNVASEQPDHPYVLVTAGGGGDGKDIIDWVIRAYERDPGIPYHAVLVFGPFMPRARQNQFHRRIAKLPKVSAITFDTRLEHLMQGAVGVVSMGGYNTFCEILSLDKKAIIVPRRKPRMEQYIRASRAAELGLVKMLSDEGGRAPAVMAAAIRGLPEQRLPSEVAVPGLLDGLENIHHLANECLLKRNERMGEQLALAKV